MHRIRRLYERCHLDEPEFRARGSAFNRCRGCFLHVDLCMCELRELTESQFGFVILFSRQEILKPSNTGRLIADLFPDTFGFVWSRTDPDQELLEMLKAPEWNPFLIFPGGGSVGSELEEVPENRGRPLFILPDGSWREARRMMARSPWLDEIPRISIEPKNASRYGMRQTEDSSQLATAEVAAQIIRQAGEPCNATVLDLWFDLFRTRYMNGRQSRWNPEIEIVEALKKKRLERDC